MDQQAPAASDDGAGCLQSVGTAVEQIIADAAERKGGLDAR
jgi:hypothetical protein